MVPELLPMLQHICISVVRRMTHTTTPEQEATESQPREGERILTPWMEWFPEHSTTPLTQPLPESFRGLGIEKDPARLMRSRGQSGDGSLLLLPWWEGVRELGMHPIQEDTAVHTGQEELPEPGLEFLSSRDPGKQDKTKRRKKLLRSKSEKKKYVQATPTSEVCGGRPRAERECGVTQ